MKERYDYSDTKLGAGTLLLIELANRVIVDIVHGQGYTLTLRQLYYQLVAGALIENSALSYKRLGSALGKGRMRGLVDWDAIEDRGRVPTLWKSFDNVQQCVDEALANFSLDWWAGQTRYVEVWTEKDALSEIIRNVASAYSVPVAVNRGYSSLSAMRAGALRFMRAINEGRECVLLYLGDHDPSGLDMIRDIGDRFDNFEAGDVLVQHLALTTAQVQLYTPPPNPTKETDSRAGKYIEQHGYESWEVDALTPSVLTELIRDEIVQLIDWDRWEEVQRDEAQQQAKAQDAVRDALVDDEADENDEADEDGRS